MNKLLSKLWLFIFHTALPFLIMKGNKIFISLIIFLLVLQMGSSKKKKKNKIKNYKSKYVLLFHLRKKPWCTLCSRCHSLYLWKSKWYPKTEKKLCCFWVAQKGNISMTPHIIDQKLWYCIFFLFLSRAWVVHPLMLHAQNNGWKNWLKSSQQIQLMWSSSTTHLF